MQDQHMPSSYRATTADKQEYNIVEGRLTGQNSCCIVITLRDSTSQSYTALLLELKTCAMHSTRKGCTQLFNGERMMGSSREGMAELEIAAGQCPLYGHFIRFTNKNLTSCPQAIQSNGVK